MCIHLSSFCFKYLSVGYELKEPPITYSHLKVIGLYQVSFDDVKEICVVLRLVTSSPNLQEFQISVSCKFSICPYTCICT